jgi:hypothetical protein
MGRVLEYGFYYLAIIAGIASFSWHDFSEEDPFSLQHRFCLPDGA